MNKSLDHTCQREKPFWFYIFSFCLDRWGWQQMVRQLQTCFPCLSWKNCVVTKQLIVDWWNSQQRKKCGGLNTDRTATDTIQLRSPITYVPCWVRAQSPPSWLWELASVSQRIRRCALAADTCLDHTAPGGLQSSPDFYLLIGWAVQEINPEQELRVVFW